MSESTIHMHYVDQLLLFAKTIIPSNYHSLIYVDKPDSAQKPPRTAQNFIPDLYYKYQEHLIIGEAKTFSDVDSRHSKMQYEDYINEAFHFQGKAIILFSIPLAAKGTIKNIVRRLVENYSGRIVVYFISDLGIVEKI